MYLANKPLIVRLLNERHHATRRLGRAAMVLAFALSAKTLGEEW